MKEFKRIEKFYDNFNKYPEPYRTQALDNFKKFDIGYKQPIYDIKDALLNGFGWDKTPEGDDYWSNFHDSLIVPKPKQIGYYEAFEPLDHFDFEMLYTRDNRVQR